MGLALSIIAVLIAAIGYNIILLKKINRLKKKSGEELFTSEEMFRLMVSCVRDYAIFMIDINGIVISWNDGASRIKGYSSEEIIGRHISIFYTDDEAESGEPEQNLSMAERAGRFEKEGWRKRKNGSLFWANVVFTAIYDDRKQLRGFAKITRGITERKKMEGQLHWFNQKSEELVRVKTAELTSVFERVSDGIIAFDNNDQITYANKKTGEINKRKPEELIGKKDEAGKRQKGLYALVILEQEVQRRAQEELGDLKPTYYQELVDSQSLLQRQESLQYRLRQLENVEVSKRRP